MVAFRYSLPVLGIDSSCYVYIFSSGSVNISVATMLVTTTIYAYRCHDFLLKQGDIVETESNNIFSNVNYFFLNIVNQTYRVKSDC